MNRDKALSWALILGMLGSGWFATEEGLAAGLRERDRDRAVRALSEARSLTARHPEVFQGQAGSRPEGVPLKTLLQESSNRHGLQLGFLSEGEKEAGKGRREQQVSARLVRAPHGKLVPFLAELEAKGRGAVVKELHLRPSKELSQTYEDAEVVLSRFVLAGPSVTPPAPTRKEAAP